VAEAVVFLGGPLDGQRTVPPTPVDNGERVGIPHRGQFLIYERVGGFMQYVDTVDVAIGPTDMPVGKFRTTKSEN
jgi:hypothetical protein